MVTKQLRRMMRTIYLDTSRRLSLLHVCLLTAAGLAPVYILLRYVVAYSFRQLGRDEKYKQIYLNIRVEVGG